MVSIWIQEPLTNAAMICNTTVLVLYKLGLRDYQRMAPQKLSDANLESILWNKVPIKLQKEVGQLTEGSLQELFQKLLKAEEIVRERERRSSSLRGSATHEFRNKASYRVPAQNTNYNSGQQKEDGKQDFNKSL